MSRRSVAKNRAPTAQLRLYRFDDAEGMVKYCFNLCPPSPWRVIVASCLFSTTLQKHYIQPRLGFIPCANDEAINIIDANRRATGIDAVSLDPIFGTCFSDVFEELCL